MLFGDLKGPWLMINGSFGQHYLVIFMQENKNYLFDIIIWKHFLFWILYQDPCLAPKERKGMDGKFASSVNFSVGLSARRDKLCPCFACFWELMQGKQRRSDTKAFQTMMFSFFFLGNL